MPSSTRTLRTHSRRLCVFLNSLQRGCGASGEPRQSFRCGKSFFAWLAIEDNLTHIWVPMPID